MKGVHVDVGGGEECPMAALGAVEAIELRSSEASATRQMPRVAPPLVSHISEARSSVASESLRHIHLKRHG